MISRPPPSAGDYWYLGSPDPAIDQLFRRACALAWPFALYCAKRYHHDSDFAYDLMDEAVENAERYYERFDGKRTALQLSYRIVSVIKRLSKQRANSNEVAVGTLSDLERFAQNFAAKSDPEQDAIIRQTLECMTDQTRKACRWRGAGASWRQIGRELGIDRMTLWRQTRNEIRALLDLKSGTPDSDERGDPD